MSTETKLTPGDWPASICVECGKAAEVERLEAENKRLKDALKLAQPILDEQLQSLCDSYCLPCEVGDTFDYSELKEPELGWITKTEAALDAVDVALAGGKGEDDAD